MSDSWKREELIWLQQEKELKAERDEARAEVERLREENLQQAADLSESVPWKRVSALSAERDALRRQVADYERALKGAEHALSRIQYGVAWGGNAEWFDDILAKTQAALARWSPAGKEESK